MLFSKKKIETAQSKCFKKLSKFTKNLIDEMIRRTYVIRDIQDLDISEEEKNRHRNIVTNQIVSELLLYQDKLKELENDYQSTI